MENQTSRAEFFRHVMPLVQLLLVWPLGILILVISGFFFSYSPQEITELQRVPLILQGDTDWGGSNVFAFYVVAHFAFGILGCLIFTRFTASQVNRPAYFRVLLGFFTAFLLVDGSFALGFYKAMVFGEEAYSELHGAYFVCDYIEVLVLFVCTYLLSCLWIILLKNVQLPIRLRYLLSPACLFLLLLAGSTGLTPKAGKVLMGYVIPKYETNSVVHGWFLGIHRMCTTCTNGYFGG